MWSARRHNPDGARVAWVLSTRRKKFLGIFFIVGLVLIYSIVAVTVAAAVLNSAPWYAHALYFGFSGVMWVLPAALIIKWMVTDSGAG